MSAFLGDVLDAADIHPLVLCRLLRVAPAFAPCRRHVEPEDPRHAGQEEAGGHGARFGLQRAERDVQDEEAVSDVHEHVEALPHGRGQRGEPEVVARHRHQEEDRQRREAEDLEGEPGEAGVVGARDEQAHQRVYVAEAVELEDRELERIWYHNQYWLACCLREGKVAPGLFGNWTSGRIGTAWHGDYHMNYNTAQPFWVTFSSNHLEKNLPYVNLIEFLMGVSTRWAKEYYELPGAYFPHSAYPVDMTMNPYPVPTWGWEVCETPWAVQGVWWHYLYSGDREFLRTRAYGPIKAAVEFLTAYMKRPEARGPQWKDDKYHIFPTVPPELYGLRPSFRYNYDCTVDLTLTKFIFRAFWAVSSVPLKECRTPGRSASGCPCSANPRCQAASIPSKFSDALPVQASPSSRMCMTTGLSASRAPVI